MTIFLRLLDSNTKEADLKSSCETVRRGDENNCVFLVDPDEFRSVPGAPFAYWVTNAVRRGFSNFPAVESEDRNIRVGLQTSDDTRFVRLFWEVMKTASKDRWKPFSKGGAFSRFYGSLHLVVDWQPGQLMMWEIINPKLGKPKSNIWMLPETIRSYFGRPGITWSRRSQKGLTLRVLPAGTFFSDKGPTAFAASDSTDDLLVLLAISNSKAFEIFVALQVAFGSYEAGTIQRTPYPRIDPASRSQLVELARKAWYLKYSLDSVSEISHAFILPAALRARVTQYDMLKMNFELNQIQQKINDIAFALYHFAESDRQAEKNLQEASDNPEVNEDDDEEEEDNELEGLSADALLSWAVGVAFGRFDWRLATGERTAPPEPEPFDPLPAKSPGMLPDGAESFHAHGGILVDEQGHRHDLARLIEEVLARVNVNIPDDVRRWLRRDFFAFHLQRYSKSRRKAPIYWPFSTISGNYTLWIYYSSLNSQTLFTAVNDFLDGSNGKLTQVSRECADLRIKGSSRSREEEKQYETLQTFEQELIELRDTLLKIAPTYQPNHDDGVQITAAPLWPLFRHKPWQKTLKDTWAKLEKGDYDWAHLTMNYWPERVREKCKTDKSLAIAHGLEELYVEPKIAPNNTRGKAKAGASE